MDGRQFDHAVRSLTRHRSRRALVAGIVGGGLTLLTARLGLSGAAARQRVSAQGEPCTDDSQCLAADNPLVCAYNGLGSAGAACCAAAGGFCGEYGDCCGPTTCYRGQCWDLTAPSAGEPCWQMAGDPDPCVEGFVCTHDWLSGGIWGTCQPVSTSGGGVAGEWCGDHFCEPWQRCCSQCSGICAPRDAVCGEGACRPGYGCPDGCAADGACPGCLSGYCLSDGTCA